MKNIKQLETEILIGLILFFGLFLFFVFMFIIMGVLDFGTGTSAYYDGEKNVECYNIRIDHENILRTYHYEMKCFPYKDAMEEKIR